MFKCMHNLTVRNTWVNLMELAERQGVITPGDVRALGLVPENLNKLVKLGKLDKIGRGLYRHPDFETTKHHSYVEVTKSVPDGVICLLSALSIHEIGTHMPWEVWVAIPRGRRIPEARQTRMRVVTMVGPSYILETQERSFEGVSVKVYSLEKTIVDCFRLRRLVGHDVAIEALREAINGQRINVSKLMQIAEQLRSRRLIQPYVEALL